MRNSSSAETTLNDQETDSNAQYELRSSGTFQVYDNALAFYRSHLSSVLLTSAIFLFPIFLIELVLTRFYLHPIQLDINHSSGDNTGSDFIWVILLNWIISVLPYFAFLMQTAALSDMIDDYVMKRAISVYRSSLKAVFGIFKIFSAGIVAGLSLLASFVCLSLLSLILYGLIAAVGGGIATGTGLVLAILLWYILNCGIAARYFIIIPSILAVEQRTIGDLWKRHQILTGQNRIRVAWSVTACIPLLLTIVYGAFYASSDVVVNTVLMHIVGINPGELIKHTITYMIPTIILAVLLPYSSLVLAFLYIELRVRHDALDLRLKASEWQTRPTV